VGIIPSFPLVARVLITLSVLMGINSSVLTWIISALTRKIVAEMKMRDQPKDEFGRLYFYL